MPKIIQFTISEKMQIQKILRYYNVNKNDSIWYQEGLCVCGGGNGYIYTLPVGITGLFSSAMQCGNKNTKNNSLKILF